MQHVYSVSDFPNADLPNAKLAVIGHPVKHSASPQMHQPALDAEGLGIDYVRIDIEPGDISKDLNHLRNAGFIGVNCTVPHKFEALDYCDRLTEDAKLLGAVNTIHFRDHEILGHNTDGPGFINAIRESFGREFKDLKVFIVGAGGGFGTAVARQAAKAGCPQLVLANRSVDKIQALKKELNSSPSEILTLAIDSPELVSAARDCDLIINATSVGLKEGDPSPLPADVFHKGHLVYDSIYSPPRTRFLKDAGAAGAKTDNGFSLLLHQGALSFELWTGIYPNLECMRQGLAK